ncbi:MAG TPA: LCP family protein [Chloroflexota bacterium]
MKQVPLSPSPSSRPLPAARRRRRLAGFERVLLGLSVAIFVGCVALGLVALSDTPVLAALVGGLRPRAGQDSPGALPAGTAGPEVSGQPGGGGVPIGEQPHAPTGQSGDDRLGFLLLGFGGPGHEGPYLTDTIVVAIVDPTKKTVTLLSIPRDSWVPLVFDGKTAVYNKVNTAYAFARDRSVYPTRLARYTGANGAGVFAMDTVSRLLGIPLSYYVAIDFAGFRKMIDAVGGVDVRVPASFTANYPAHDNPAVDPGWITVRFREGVEHMDGARALQFARARDVIDNPEEGSDFARSRRQRLIMEAFKDRVLQPTGLIYLPKLLDIAATHVDTNYSIPAVAQLGQLALDWSGVRIYQTALTQENYLEPARGYGGASVLVPSTPDRSWAPIRAFARRLWEDPATGVAMAENRVVVVNNTGVAGAAGRLSEILRRFGYRVEAPVNGVPRDESRLVLRPGAESAELVAAGIERDLGTRLVRAVEAAGAVDAELVLELGRNDLHLLDVEPPADGEAPASAVGLEQPGEESWAVDAAALEPPTPTVEAVATLPAVTATPAPTAPPATDAVATREVISPTPTSASVGPPPADSPTAATPTATPAASSGAAPTPTSGVATATPTAAVPGASPTPVPTVAATVEEEGAP